jgi:hypothetical protein
LGFFCLKIFHLATLVEMEVSFSVESHFFWGFLRGRLCQWLDQPLIICTRFMAAL